MRKFVVLCAVAAVLAGALTMLRASAEMVESHSLKGTVEAVISEKLVTVKLLNKDHVYIVDLSTDDTTVYENVESLAELDKGDVVSVDFSSFRDQNMAQKIKKIGAIRVQAETVG